MTRSLRIPAEGALHHTILHISGWTMQPAFFLFQSNIYFKGIWMRILKSLSKLSDNRLVSSLLICNTFFRDKLHQFHVPELSILTVCRPT